VRKGGASAVGTERQQWGKSDSSGQWEVQWAVGGCWLSVRARATCVRACVRAPRAHTP